MVLQVGVTVRWLAHGELEEEEVLTFQVKEEEVEDLDNLDYV